MTVPGGAGSRDEAARRRLRLSVDAVQGMIGRGELLDLAQDPRTGRRPQAGPTSMYDGSAGMVRRTTRCALDGRSLV